MRLGSVCAKKALTEEAYFHIRNIQENYAKLKSVMNNIKLAKPHLGENDITFEYISSPRFDSLLFKEITEKNKEKLFSYLNQYKMMVLQQPLDFIENFEPEAKFNEVFGVTPSFTNVMCLSLSNVDLTFDNLTFDQGQFTVIDYEWVFEIMIPVEFILFRSVNEFYAKYSDYLNHFAKKEEFLRFFGINFDYIPIFEKMEKGFQQYVFGQGREYQNAERVLKHITSLEEILSEIKVKDEKLRSLHEQIEQIQKEAEQIQKEADQLVSSLNLQISSKEHDIDELNKKGWKLKPSLQSKKRK